MSGLYSSLVYKISFWSSNLLQKEQKNMNLNTLLYLLYNFFGVERHIQSITIVNCLSELDSVKLLKGISTESFSVHLMSSNSFNATSSAKFIQKASGSLGVFLDYNCASSDRFIESVSTLILFFHHAFEHGL